MWAKNKQQTGFTIVELLIVIVVIAILAAITVVAFNGIQGRAADTAVQSDLRGLALKVRDHHALNGAYPNGGASTSFPGGITYSINRQAYTTNTNNLYYCTVHSGANARFAVAALSSSGNIIVHNGTGFQTYSGTSFTASGNICPGVGIPTTEENYEFHYGHTSAGSWLSWTR